MQGWKKQASRKAKRDRRPASVYFRLKSGRDSGDRVCAFVVTHWMPLPAPPNTCDKCGSPRVTVVKFVDPDKTDLNFCQLHADEYWRGA